MSDEQQVTPDAGNSAEQIDWEQRAKDQQAGFTKSQQELAAERALWENEDEALKRFAEKFPHRVINDDEDEDNAEPEFEPGDDPRFSELEQRTKAHEEWIEAQRTAERNVQNQAAFDRDLAEEAGERELTQRDKDYIFARTVALGDGRENLKRAVKEWFDDAPAPKRPRVPHAVTSGQAATHVPDWDKMTPGEQNKYMAERVLGHEAQT